MVSESLSYGAREDAGNRRSDQRRPLGDTAVIVAVGTIQLDYRFAKRVPDTARRTSVQ